MGEISQYFKDQSQQDILVSLQQYQQQAIQIRQTIQQAINDYNKTIIDNQSVSTLLNVFDSMNKFTSESSLLRNQLLKARISTNLNKAYIDGYRFLNDVGKYFSGKSWDYSITLFGRKNITFHMTLDQFLEFGEFHLKSGFRLMTGKKSMLAQAAKLGIQGEEWSNDASNETRYNTALFAAYRGAIQYARKVLRQANKRAYNEGQILEGYFAFSEDTKNLSLLSRIAKATDTAKISHLGKSKYTDLRDTYSQFTEQRKQIYESLQTQTNTRGFWTGGDTEEEGQVKGIGAGIFAENTIINQLDKFINITSALNFDKLNSTIASYAGEGKQALLDRIQQILNTVKTSFEATRIGASAFDELKEFSDVDNIIASLFGS